MPARRSIILKGQTTSISLEDKLWDELDRQAAVSGLKWQEYARKLLAGCARDANRAGFLREVLVARLRGELNSASSRAEAFKSTWVVDGAEGVKRFDFWKALIVLGRGDGNDIQLSDVSVSKRHLALIYDGDDWWAVDLGAKNGTWSRDGQRLVRQRFGHGDKLRIGSTTIINIS